MFNKNRNQDKPPAEKPKVENKPKPEEKPAKDNNETTETIDLSMDEGR